MSNFSTQEIALEADEKDLELLKAKIQNSQVNIKDQFNTVKQFMKELQNVKNQNERLRIQLKEATQKQQQFHQTKRGNPGTSFEEFRKSSSNTHFNKHFYTPQISSHKINQKNVETNILVQETKRKVINGFVQQLTQQLQVNEEELRKEKKMHLQTKQYLAVCLKQMSQVKIRLQNQEYNQSYLTRENQVLKDQLKIETEKRLNLEKAMSAKQTVTSHYQDIFLERFSDYDRQLNRMDQIYLKIEKEINI